VPVAAVSRAHDWSLARTGRVALLCGIGHVSVSVALGIVALVSGLAVVDAIGERAAAAGGVLLVAFGLGYALWGLRKRAHRHVREATSTWTLFAIYCADPCIAVVPILFAAAPLSRLATLAIVVSYEVATIATMVALTTAARAGASLVRARWVDRYGDTAAGGVIAATGALVALAGW